MKYKVFDKTTKKDITDQYSWVITPNGELNYLVYGDLIGHPNAMYITAEGIDELNKSLKAVDSTRPRCPKCGSEMRIIKESNWDNLDTYLYPVCDNCKWTTKEVFYNIAQIKEHLKTNF